MCDCVCALAPATAGGSTLFAKNSDRPPDEAQRIEAYPARRDEGRLRATHIEIDPHPGETVGFVGSRPWWLWGVEHGVNDAGVAIGNETIFTRDDPRRAPPALVGMDLVRLGLERSTSAAGAVEVVTGLLERYGQGGPCHWPDRHPYWSSFLVADPSDAWVVETSGREWEAERVERTRAISNRTTIPSFDAARRHPGQPVETLVDPRWSASKAVLAAEPVTAHQLVQHLRSHVGEQGYTVCVHVPGVEATTAAMIVSLPFTGSGSITARFLLGSPCRSVFVPIYPSRPLGQPVEWERFARLTDEDRAALDDLEAQLVADATDDDEWNAEAWRRVDDLLRKLVQ